MAGMISLSLPAFDYSFSNPVQGHLTTDGKSVSGELTIFPGIKIDGVKGSQTTIGGATSSVTVENGKASFSGNVSILKQSHTFNNGEVLSLQASVSVDEALRFTVKLTGSDTVPDALKFDPNDSDKFAKGKVVMKGSITLKEDPLFKEAGILVPGFTNFKRWVQKLTISVQATLEDKAREAGGTNKTATLTRTLEWALRPLFGKNDVPDDRPDDPPSDPIDWTKVPVKVALPSLLFVFLKGYPIKFLQQLPKGYLNDLIEEFSSVISKIKSISFNAANDVMKAQEAVDQLATESTELTQGIEAVEAEMEAAETGIETAEAGLEAAEGALAAAESAEVAAASEVAAATAAEAAADASEAADWWTIIGGIISGGAIAAAAAALAHS